MTLDTVAYQIMTNAYETHGLQWAVNVEAYRELDDGELVTELLLEERFSPVRYVHTINPRRVAKALIEMTQDERLTTQVRIATGKMFITGEYYVPDFVYNFERNGIDDQIIHYAVTFGKDW